jgi:hypothetical protein
MGSPYIYLAVLVVAILAISLILQDHPLVVLLVLTLFPLSVQAGINPWILAFLVNLLAAPFFFPYQSQIYLLSYYSSGGKAFSHRQGRLVALCFAAVVLITVILCIPYWQAIGLIVHPAL